MKSRTSLFAAAFIVGQTFAQNASAIGPILSALQAQNLTTLATVAQSIANTTVGQELLGLLTSGQPLTVFAPDNHAFSGVPANITSNPNLVAEILSYHVVQGNYNDSFFGPNANTVLRTALNASDQVFLGPGDQHQVLVGRLDGSNIRILNQNTEVKAYNSSTIPSTNIVINKVDSVIDLPGTFEDVFKSNNLTAFRTAALQAGLLESLNVTHGITIFAPSDAAFAKVARQFAGMGANVTQLKTVLMNHVLNGSVVYSSELAPGENFTTASGEVLTVSNSSDSSSSSSNRPGSSGGLRLSTTVSETNTTTNASFLQTDLISWSGVLHIIDTVLLNNDTDQAAADSAYAQATASAASVASVAETASATSPGGPGIVGSAGTTGGSASETAKGGVATGAAVGGVRVFGFGLKAGGVVGLSAVMGAMVLGGFTVLL